MSRSFLKQDTQINSSYDYDDTLVSGIALQNTGSHLERDLNALRSQVKRLLSSASGNWYDNLTTIIGLDGSKQRGLAEIAFELDDIESKRILCPVQVLTDVVVSSSFNVVVLSPALNTSPTNTMASGAFGLGTIVAELPSGSDIGTGSLALISGANALLPINLIKVRDAITKDPVSFSGSEVYGLLQVESGGLSQGASFDDATRQGQISFVYVSSGTDQFSLVSSAAIGGHIVEYMYAKRVSLETLPEDCTFPNIRFLDQSAASEVTLENAIDNQIGPVTMDQNIDIDISNSFAWAFRSGSTDLWTVQNNTTGGEVEINATSYDNNATTNDFSNGVTIDSSGNPITIGVVDGLIQASGTLTVASDNDNDLIISGNRELLFDDGNQSGSTWAQTTGIKLSDTTEEWNTFESLFGEVSILSALISGSNAGGHSKGVAVATANISANVNARIGVNLSGSFPSYTTGSFYEDANVYLNGQLLRNGEDAGADHDVYPGTDPNQGDLKFEFAIKGTGATPDVITLETFH